MSSGSKIGVAIGVVLGVAFIGSVIGFIVLRGRKRNWGEKSAESVKRHEAALNAMERQRQKRMMKDESLWLSSDRKALADTKQTAAKDGESLVEGDNGVTALMGRRHNRPTESSNRRKVTMDVNDVRFVVSVTRLHV
jgi:hypothetical protein